MGNAYLGIQSTVVGMKWANQMNKRIHLMLSLCLNTVVFNPVALYETGTDNTFQSSSYTFTEIIGVFFM